MENLLNKLSKIQATINVAKNQKNSFGNYNYRSCEDILQALQPMVKELNVVVLLSDEIKELMNGWVYVEATATIKDCESNEEISVKAQAGIQERKGMDLSQTFGASSSYARKYALNGLLKLDDNKDADTDAFTKLIKKNDAENVVVEKPKKQVEKPQSKEDKKAEKMDAITQSYMNAIKSEGTALPNNEFINDADLPFLMEEKQVNVLEQLQDAIADKCNKLNTNMVDMYGYYCKQFKKKSVEELNSEELMTICNKLDELMEKRGVKA